MPLGAAATSTIDIDFTRAQGTNSQGRITFTPPRVVVGTTVISRRGVVVEIVDGVGEIDLVRLPAGTYQVREEIDGTAPYEYSFALPTNAAATVEYESIASVDPVPEVYTVVRSVNGVLPDLVTGNVTVTAEAGPHTHLSTDISDFVSAVDARLAVVIDGAPTTLNTLNELAQALGDDPNFAATIMAALGGKVNASVVDAAGDLVVGVAADTVGRLPIGSEGKLLGVASGSLSWVDPPAGGGVEGGTALMFRRTTGLITGAGSTFLAGEDGPWAVCPAIWRPPAGPAEAGQVIDLLVSAILGATSADGAGNPGGAGAEMDFAAIDNSNPAAPVILRCKSSGTNTPLPNGYGGLYIWASTKRFPGILDWVVEAGDLVSGTITLALLYRNTASGGSSQGLRIGHSSLWPGEVVMRNNGTPFE
jgi:hypothetical protein